MSKKLLIYPLIIVQIAVIAILSVQIYNNNTTKGKQRTYIGMLEQEKAKLPQFIIVEKIKAQAEIDKMLLAELKSGAYTFEDPFVLVDPYNESPLTAIALFTTKEPMKISIHIAGDHKNDEVQFDFDNFNTEHSIPIYGLYAERINKVTLTGEYKNGRKENIVLEVETKNIPSHLNPFTIITESFKEENYSKGLNLNYVVLNATAFDSNGKWRWALDGWRNKFTNRGTYSKGNNGFFLPSGSYHMGNIYITEVNALGRILNVYYSPYGCHHDLTLTSYNTILLTGSNNNITVEDFISEIDLETGKIINEVDYKDILLTGRKYYPYSSKDWLHMNSIIEYDSKNIIISGKNQSLVMKNDFEGNIKWILSNPIAYLDIYKEYLLTPIGENFEYQYSQHAVEILPDYDNNPDTVDILLFDNGNARKFVNAELQRQVKANEIIDPPLYSRLVHYRIHEKNMTVEQIWSYGEDKPELYSVWCGDADLLSNDNILGVFDIVVNDTKSQFNYTTYIEVNKNKEEVWQALIQNKNHKQQPFYRAERMNIYTPNANDLRLGNEVKNFIPDELLK